jgi:hypothetical protein
MFHFVAKTHAAFLFYRPEAGNTKSREHHATSWTKSLQPLIGWRWQYLRRIRFVGFLLAHSVISPARTQVCIFDQSFFDMMTNLKIQLR